MVYRVTRGALVALVLAGCAGGPSPNSPAEVAPAAPPASSPPSAAPGTFLPTSAFLQPAAGLPTSTPLPSGEDLFPTAVAIMSLVNEMRIEEGVSALTPSAELITIAFQRSDGMLAHKYFGHTDPFDLTVPVLALLQSAGFHGALAENLFAIAAPLEQVPQAALEAWTLSASHQALLLDSRYHFTGVGLTSDGTWWKVTQVLAEAGP